MRDTAVISGASNPQHWAGAFNPAAHWRGSMLEVALISAHAAHLTTRADLAFALRAVSDAPALAMRLTDYGLKAGARADLQLLPVPTWEEALRLQALPEKVWFKGRLVADNATRAVLHRLN